MPSTGPQSNSSLRDNRAHQGSIGEFLKSVIQLGSHLPFVSAYFTVHAYEAHASQPEGAAKLRFLFGEPSFVMGTFVETTHSQWPSLQSPQHS